MAQVNETANNDTIATATNLGNIRNSPFVRGDLFGSDAADFFKFQVDRPVKGGIAVVPQGVDTNLVLFNSSGQQIRNSLNPGTAIESIAFDNLPTGEYTLLVSKSTGSGSYTLSANGTAITRAQLSVTIDRVKALERFDTPIPFTNFGEADFFITAAVQQSKVFGNDNDISPNFTVTKDVDVNEPFLRTSISVREDDPGSSAGINADDTADVNPDKQKGGFDLTFDVSKSEIVSAVPSFRVREGEVVTLEGDGSDGSPELADIFTGKARISFRVNYDTFTSSTSSFSNSTPIIRGTNASQDLTGKNQGGILCGEGGNDNLSGMGGNDALCGGTGNDILNGGTGNDISYGGAGRDTHSGSFGKDTFVLILNSGTDIVKDFQNGKDKLGLSIELNPEILEITQQGKNTIVGVGDQRLAVLTNTKASQITAADFVTVDFTQFRGIEVPTIIT